MSHYLSLTEQLGGSAKKTDNAKHYHTQLIKITSWILRRHNKTRLTCNSCDASTDRNAFFKKSILITFYTYSIRTYDDQYHGSRNSKINRFTPQKLNFKYIISQ